jgi:hypothetical protein
LPAKNATSGGSSDTDANEPTDMPAGPSSPAAVITVTPVGKCPNTWRNRAPSIADADDAAVSGMSLMARDPSET